MVEELERISEDAAVT